LSECLISLKKSNFNSFEIIISDNSSTDGSQQWIKDNHPDVILIENKKILDMLVDAILVLKRQEVNI